MFHNKIFFSLEFLYFNLEAYSLNCIIDIIFIYFLIDFIYIMLPYEGCVSQKHSEMIACWYDI